MATWVFPIIHYATGLVGVATQTVYDVNGVVIRATTTAGITEDPEKTYNIVLNTSWEGYLDFFDGTRTYRYDFDRKDGLSGGGVNTITNKISGYGMSIGKGSDGKILSQLPSKCTYDEVLIVNPNKPIIDANALEL